jgi:hypothetical protein
VPLNLLHHTKGNLSEFQNDTLSITASTPFCLSHNDLSLHSQLDRLAIVQIFKRHTNGVVHVFALAGTLPLAAATARTAAATKKHAKEIIVAASAASSTAAIFHALETVLVVLGSHFIVRQNFVGRIDFLEFVFVAALVGVVYHGQFAVCLFDLLASDILFYL